MFSSYFERDYVTGFIYNLCRKILNTAHTAPVVWLAWFWQWRWVSRWSQAPCSSPGYLTNVLLTPSSTCSPSRIILIRERRHSELCSVSVTLCYCHIHEQCYESQTWIVLIKLTGEFIKKLQTWHGWRKLSNKTWVVNVFIIHLDIYLFFVPIISTDCWGQFVWISRLRVSCSPGLSPAARCRCRDLGREPWQVISVMSERRRHYGQPQGSLQLFEADSFFVDESCIMQPISNLVKKVKHNKCSNQNCIIGGAHKWPILERKKFSTGWSHLWTSQFYLTLNIPKYRNRRCDDNFISWKSSLIIKWQDTLWSPHRDCQVSRVRRIQEFDNISHIPIFRDYLRPPDLSQSHLFGLSSDAGGNGKGPLSSLCSLLEHFLRTFCQGWGVFKEITRTSKSLFENSFLWSWCFSTSDPSLPNPILLSFVFHSLWRPSISGCQYWLVTLCIFIFCFVFLE